MAEPTNKRPLSDAAIYDLKMQERRLKWLARDAEKRKAKLAPMGDTAKQRAH